jgi:putative ABC transport system permease protein
MLHDLLYAIRSLLRQRTGALSAILALGLGIGGTTTVFTVVQAVVLRPLPFEEPDRLLRIWELTRDGDRFSFSDSNFLDVQAQSRTLSHVAAYRDLGMSAVIETASGEVRRIALVPMSPSLPALLGRATAQGRMFTDAEERVTGAAAPILLSDRLWHSAFAADRDVVGRVMRVDGGSRTVVGVMPPGFDFPGGADAWIPLAAAANGDRTNKELAVIARMAPGANVVQVRSELRTIAGSIAAAHPVSNAGWSLDVASFTDWLIAPRFRQATWMLFASVGLLLLLACANVANLLLARGASRREELRIRAALGASRSRLVRQLLAEAVALAAAGTAVGVILAAWGVAVVRSLGGSRIPRLDLVSVDGSVLAFACVAGASSALVFGLVPAFTGARQDLRTGMGAGARYTTGGRGLRRALVVVEVTLAMVLMIGAGLLGASFIRLTTVDAGFDDTSALALPVDLPSTRYPEERVAGFYRELQDRFRAIPGVAAVGATSTNPFRQFGFANNVTPEERAAEAPPSGLLQAGWRSVTPGLFEALRIPLKAGRTFTDGDDGRGERVVIASESLARRLWPGESAIGKRIFWGGTTGRTRTVVGVVGDIRDVRLDAEPGFMLFLPHGQVDLPAMTVIVRVAGETEGVTTALRSALHEMDPGLPAPDIQRVATGRTELTSGPRFNLVLLTSFALIGIVLAATGVYAMLAFAVTERRREMAVRVALGATAERVAGLVLREGLGLAAMGVVAGALLGLAGARAMSGLLFGIQPTDPTTFLSAAAILLVVAVAACLVPARQAVRVDTMTLLRE